jgi:hypothetical protein
MATLEQYTDWRGVHLSRGAESLELESLMTIAQYEEKYPEDKSFSSYPESKWYERHSDR